MVKYFLKFLIFLFKATFYVAIVITALITVGAFIAALFDVFPVASIIIASVLATAVISVAAYRIVTFVKKKRKEAFSGSRRKPSEGN